MWQIIPISIKYTIIWLWTWNPFTLRRERSNITRFGQNQISLLFLRLKPTLPKDKNKSCFVAADRSRTGRIQCEVLTTLPFFLDQRCWRFSKGYLNNFSTELSSQICDCCPRNFLIQEERIDNVVSTSHWIRPVSRELVSRRLICDAQAMTLSLNNWIAKLTRESNYRRVRSCGRIIFQ